jgi:hypothetical protein
MLLLRAAVIASLRAERSAGEAESVCAAAILGVWLLARDAGVAELLPMVLEAPSAGRGLGRGTDSAEAAAMLVTSMLAVTRLVKFCRDT